MKTNYTGSYKGVISEYKRQYKSIKECTPIEPLLYGSKKLNLSGPSGPNFTYKKYNNFGFTQVCGKCPQKTNDCCHEKEYCSNVALESKSNCEYCKSLDAMGVVVTNNCQYKDVKKCVEKSMLNTSFFFPGYPPSSIGKPFGPRQIYPSIGRRNNS